MARHNQRGAGIGFTGKSLTKLASARPSFEQLENRQMLASAALVSGVLTVTGDTTQTNKLQVELSSSSSIVAKFNGSQKTFTRSAVQSIVVRGGDKADYLAVTSALTTPATIRAGSGYDTVWAGGGNDVIYGGGGNDSLSGRNGNDTLYGEAGNDTIDGGAGTDKYDGGDGTNKYTTVEGLISGTGGSTGGGTSGSGGGEPIGQLPGTGTPNAVISAQVTSITEGNAVHVHALSSTLNGGTPVSARYEWDFGDPSSKYNKLVGFNAAHVYDTPGSYTITLRVINEGGKSDNSTQQINVGTDNRRTIYVSSAGSDGAGGTQSSPVKTFGKARSLAGSSDNTRILFRRGDTFSVSYTWSVTGDNVAIGAYGTGSLPTLKWDGDRVDRAVFFINSSNVAVSDLSFTSRFTDTEKNEIPEAFRLSGHNITIRGVEFLNVGNAVNSNLSPTGVLIQDSSAPSDVGLRSYFAWVEGKDIVLLGNRVANSTREAIFRVSRDASRILLHGNDFTNRSRVSAGDRLDTSKNTISIQWGSYAYLSNNKLNNGPVRIGPLGDADGMVFYNSRFSNAVLENNVFNAPTFTLHGASNVMWRNNVSTTHGYNSYAVEGYNSQYNRGVTNVSFINNTGINQSIKGKFLDVGGSVNGINLVNNLYSAPNLQPGAFETAAVFVSSSDLSSFRVITNNVWSVGDPLGYAEGGMNYVWSSWSNSAGYRTAAEWNALPQVGTDVFSDVSVGGNYAPSASSAAANAGRLYGGVFTDFYGKYRPATGAWSAGAVEA